MVVIMSKTCENCIEYAGKGFYCLSAHYVNDGLEATYCDDWIFNGDDAE